MSDKEPLWWGRGSDNCLAIVMDDNGPYHRLFIGNGKTGEAGPDMHLATDELENLIAFLESCLRGEPWTVAQYPTQGATPL